MNKRDLKADLELIESMNKHFVEESGDFVREEILPHALKRAIAAEEEVEQLREENERLTKSVANWQWYAIKHLEAERKFGEAMRELERIVDYGDGYAVDMAMAAIQRIQEGMAHE